MTMSFPGSVPGSAGLTFPAVSANPGPAQSPNFGDTDRGICTLTFQGRVLQFRTNPNSIWWSYELLTNVQQTYGGRVIQLLGTRLGDLQVKVECGRGGWEYLRKVVLWLRDLLTDQRNGNTAEFEYTTRDWRLRVYGLSIPFQDEVEATTRELTLNFKIQEDINSTLSQITLSAELMRLQDGIYGPGQNVHNQFNDPNMSQAGNLGYNQINPSGPAYAPTGVTNNVFAAPFGSFI